MAIHSVQSNQTYNPAKNTAKTVAKAAVVTAAVATTLALGAKNGKFAVNDKTNKALEKIFPYLEKAGRFINKKVDDVAYKIAKTGIKGKIVNSPIYSKTKDKINGIVQKTKDLDIKGKANGFVQKIRDFDIKGKAKAKLMKIEEYIKTNMGKYNPDKASVADMAAETFNNFVK